MFYGYVGGKVRRFLPGGIFALLHKDRRQTVSQHIFGIMKDIWLVVNHDIMIRRVKRQNFVQVLLFVNIDQYAPLVRICKIAMEDFLRLEKTITIGDNDSQSKRAQISQRLKGMWVKCLEERIVVEDGLYMSKRLLIHLRERCLLAQLSQGTRDINHVLFFANSCIQI